MKENVFSYLYIKEILSYDYGKKEIRKSRLVDLVIALDDILKKEFGKDMYIEYIDRCKTNQFLALGIIGEEDSMSIETKYCKGGLMILVNDNEYFLNYAKE